MEILVTIAYFFLVRLVFFEYGWLRFNLFWKFVVFGLYAAAALTEIIMLGQFAPYTKEAFVNAYVLEIAPEWGGLVTKVQAEANTEVKKGDPLFEMDPSTWEDRVKQVKPMVATAQRHYDDAVALVAAGAARQIDLEERLDDLNAVKAKLADAQYKVDHAVVRAPTDGYVVNLELRAGTFIRLKAPVMSFVSTDTYRLVGLIPQVASQWVREGNEAEIAFDMYPGRVFEAKVAHVVWAAGEAAAAPSGMLPTLQQFKLASQFAVLLELTEEDPDRPLRFGASGLAAIYTGQGPAVFTLLRKLEIRSESFLNFVYNPF